MKRFFSLLSLFTLILAASFVATNQSGAAAGMANPREEATITFDFDGLMAVCLGDPSKVSVGLVHDAHHKPELTITKIKGEQRTQIAVIDAKKLRDTFHFEVENNKQLGVNRYITSSMDDVNDLRWTIDLEGELHQKQLYIKEDKLVGKLHFHAGLFYADHMSERPVRFFAADNSGKTLPFNRHTAGPMAKLNLDLGDALVISSSKETIRLVAERGVRYEITVNNLPPPEMASMDHWVYYYDIIGEKVTPYIPIMVNKTAAIPAPMLCRPVMFSKSKLN